MGATSINEEMKIACVKAIADLAMAESSEVVSRAYGGRDLIFGPDYIIPKPFDPRLIVRLAPAVARAAMEKRRGNPSHCRFQELPPAPDPVRLSNGHYPP